MSTLTDAQMANLKDAKLKELEKQVGEAKYRNAVLFKRLELWEQENLKVKLEIEAKAKAKQEKEVLYEANRQGRETMRQMVDSLRKLTLKLGVAALRKKSASETAKETLELTVSSYDERKHEIEKIKRLIDTLNESSKDKCEALQKRKEEVSGLTQEASTLKIRAEQLEKEYEEKKRLQQEQVVRKSVEVATMDKEIEKLKDFLNGEAEQKLQDEITGLELKFKENRQTLKDFDFDDSFSDCSSKNSFKEVEKIPIPNIDKLFKNPNDFQLASIISPSKSLQNNQKQASGSSSISNSHMLDLKSTMSERMKKLRAMRAKKSSAQRVAFPAALSLKNSTQIPSPGCSKSLLALQPGALSTAAQKPVLKVSPASPVPPPPTESTREKLAAVPEGESTDAVQDVEGTPAKRVLRSRSKVGSSESVDHSIVSPAAALSSKAVEISENSNEETKNSAQGATDINMEEEDEDTHKPNQSSSDYNSADEENFEVPLQEDLESLQKTPENQPARVIGVKDGQYITAQKPVEDTDQDFGQLFDCDSVFDSSVEATSAEGDEDISMNLSDDDFNRSGSENKDTFAGFFGSDGHSNGTGDSLF